MEEEASRAETEKKIKSLLNLRNAIERNKVKDLKKISLIEA